MTRAQRSPSNPRESITSLQVKHYSNSPKTALPHTTRVCPSPLHWAPSAHPGAQAGAVTAPTRGQKHKPQGQQRCRRWLHTRLNHEVLAAVRFTIFRVRPRCRLQSTKGGAHRSNQLIRTQFWVGQAHCSNYNARVGHLNTDLQVLVRCLRSQQLHCELLESITLKLSNLHGKSVGLNTDWLGAGTVLLSVVYSSLEATPGSTHTLPDGKQSKYSFSHSRNISVKNRNSKYLIKSVMQKGSAMPTLWITCNFPTSLPWEMENPRTSMKILFEIESRGIEKKPSEFPYQHKA